MRTEQVIYSAVRITGRDNNSSFQTEIIVINMLVTYEL